MGSHYVLSLECRDGDAKERATVEYRTATGDVVVDGLLYVRELELANAVVRLVKAYQKHGPDSLGAMRGEVEID